MLPDLLLTIVVVLLSQKRAVIFLSPIAITKLSSLLGSAASFSTTKNASPHRARATYCRRTSRRRRRHFPRLRRSSLSAPRIVSTPLNASEQDIHVQMMEYALDEAHQAGQMGEVPIGAIVVRELTAQPPQLSNQLQSNGNNHKRTFRRFEVISKGRNLVETKMDASAHAELEAMKVAASHLENWRLLNTTLYSTLEPCPMCLAAAQAFRCKSVVYGAPDLRLGAVKTHIQLLEMAKHPYHEVETLGGILEEESATMLRDFFCARRKQSNTREEIEQDGKRGTRYPRITGQILGFVKKLNPFHNVGHM